MVELPMDAFEQPRAGTGTERQAEDSVDHAYARDGRPTLFTAVHHDAPGAAPSRSASSPGGRVADAIEAALVPRLVMLHGGRSAAPAVRTDAALAAIVAPFAASLIADDDSRSAHALLRQLRSDGASFDAICLDVMAPAARQLGAMWETDDCDFALVTLGLSRLHRLMREMDALLAAAVVPLDLGRVAMLAATPGEQHVFGLAMVGDFLRRAGWEVHDLIGATSAEITQMARSTCFTVAALSCSATAGLPALAGRITGIRGAARNREVAIMVGGLAFIDAPDAIIRVGADAMARDARDAVFQAERLLAVSRAALAVR